jgi:hypothetical protein
MNGDNEKENFIASKNVLSLFLTSIIKITFIFFKNENDKPKNNVTNV